MNNYTIRLKDLLCALGTFEYVKVAEDLPNDEFGHNRELVFAEDFVGSIENDEDYKFLREKDYRVVDVMTVGDENYGAMLRILVEEFDK